VCTARFARQTAGGENIMVAAIRSFDKQTGKLLYNKEVSGPEHQGPAPTVFHTLHLDPRMGTIELIGSRLKVRHFPRGEK
jgi:hypothetical protein